jgi:hypothetical protein
VVLQLELLDGEGSTPKTLHADARKVADFGLRIATEEDFEERDLPVPAEIMLQAKAREKAEEKKEGSVRPDLHRLANFGDL